MSTAPATLFLRNLEWSMGNGQCPECCGCKPGFDSADDPFIRRQGHLRKCTLAKGLVSLGEQVVWDHQPKQSKIGKAKFDAFFKHHTVKILGQLP